MTPVYATLPIHLGPPVGQLDLGMPPKMRGRDRAGSNPSRAFVPPLFVVYVARNADDVCLYVGKSKEFDARRRRHREKEWYGRVARWETNVCDSAWKMDDLERKLIFTLDPLHNDQRPPWPGDRLPGSWPSARR